MFPHTVSRGETKVSRVSEDAERPKRKVRPARACACLHIQQNHLKMMGKCLQPPGQTAAKGLQKEQGTASRDSPS